MLIYIHKYTHTGRLAIFLAKMKLEMLCTSKYTHTHAHMHIYTHTYTQGIWQSLSRRRNSKCDAHQNIHIHTHICIYIHTHICIYIHTHTHRAFGNLSREDETRNVMHITRVDEAMVLLLDHSQRDVVAAVAGVLVNLSSDRKCAGIYMCVCVCVCVFIYVYTSMCMYVCMHGYVYLFV